MTQNSTILGPKIALYEPDIPQNTAAIIRTCACLGAKLEIIEPCGFLLSDKRFKRVVMDYMDYSQIEFYQSSEKSSSDTRTRNANKSASDWTTWTSEPAKWNIAQVYC